AAGSITAVSLMLRGDGVDCRERRDLAAVEFRGPRPPGEKKAMGGGRHRVAEADQTAPARGEHAPGNGAQRTSAGGSTGREKGSSGNAIAHRRAVRSMAVTCVTNPARLT